MGKSETRRAVGQDEALSPKAQEPPSLSQLFWSFVRIGAVLIGGGYALLPLLEREMVQRRGWARAEEMADLYALSQLLPGVIALNTAMLAGHRLRGRAGLLVSAAGLTIVPFLLIAAYAAAYSAMRDTAFFSRMLSGLQPAVAGMILGFGTDMVRRNAGGRARLALAAGTALAVLFFDPAFGWLILFSLVAGLAVHAVNARRASP